MHLNRSILLGPVGVVLILTIIEIILNGFTIILYSLPAIFLILYSFDYLSKSLYSTDIADRRINWFYSRIADIDRSIQYNIQNVQQFSEQNLTIGAKALKAEIGISPFKMDVERELPDITVSEIELTKLEERSSIILGSVVFIPVLFALIHLFRSVTLIEFIIELIIAVNLGLLVLSSQSKRYTLSGWDDVYSFLFTHRDEIIVNPRKFMIETPTAKEYKVQELGIRQNFNASKPSDAFLHMFIEFLIELKPDQRDQYIESILVSIDELPGKQMVMEQKWQTYTTRLLMIAISSTALGALFASLSSFRIPSLSSSGFVFETTTYLVWGEYLLLIVLNFFVLRQWFSLIKSISWTGILTVIYFSFYYLNQVII